MIYVERLIQYYQPYASTLVQIQPIKIRIHSSTISAKQSNMTRFVHVCKLLAACGNMCCNRYRCKWMVVFGRYIFVSAMYHYWMGYRGGICNKNISIRVRWRMFDEIYMLILLCEGLTIFTKVDFLCGIAIQHTNCIQTIMGAYDTRFDGR